MHETRRLLRERDGISLLELIAALFVLTTGMFGVISMYHFGLDKMRVLNEHAIAMRAAQNEIETLRSLPFSELRDTDRRDFASDTPELSMLVNAAPTVHISDYDADRTMRLKQVIVRIKWTGEHGRTVEKKVTTLIADKGQT